MSHRDEEATKPRPVLADEPLFLTSTRARLRRVLLLYALLPLICAAAGAYTAYTVASVHTDRRIGRLEADLAQRRAATAAQNATRDAQLQRLRALVCVFADRITPRDAAVEQVRAEYQCTGPLPTTGVGGPPATTGPARPREPDRQPRPPPAPRPPPPPPPPAPAPAPAPPPAPAPAPPAVRVCLLVLCIEI